MPILIIVFKNNVQVKREGEARYAHNVPLKTIRKTTFAITDTENKATGSHVITECFLECIFFMVVTIKKIIDVLLVAIY